MTSTQALPLARPEVASEAAHRIVEDFTRRSRIPGLSIAIVDRHGPLFTAGYGHRDLATGDPATPETTYLWFSLTKIVTATAALRLADDGALDLDAPISEALPQVPRSSATVRQLLNHTAGFANPAPIRWVRPATAPARPPEDLLDRLLHKRRQTRRDAGGSARYSNLGYLVLGSVIEAAAQQPFTSYVRETILRPLGLTATDFTHVEPRLAATGYVKAPRAVAPLLRAVLPAGIVGPRTGAYQALQPFYVEGPSYGGLVGSVIDAGRFATAHLNDGALDGTRILRADTTRRMRHIDTPGKKIDVGQGWFRKAEHRTSTPPHVEHLGAGGGFFNVMRLYPSLGLGFVVMTNTTSPYAHHELFNDLLRLPWPTEQARKPGDDMTTQLLIDDATRVELRPTGFRTFAAQRPILTQLAFIIVVIWPLMAVPLLAHHRVIGGRGALEALPMGPEETTSILMVAALLSFSLWLVHTADGPGSVHALLRRASHWRFGVPGWLTVVGALPAATVALGVAFGRDLETTGLVRTIVEGVGVLVLLVFVVNLWEETIWAGFVQTRLERRHRLAVAAAMTAVPFSLVHVPLAFVDEPFSVELAIGQFIVLMILTVFFRTLLGVAMRGLDRSVLAVAFLHTSFNRSNNTGGLADQLLSGDDHGKFGLLAMLLLLAITAVLWRRPRRNGHRPGGDEARSNQP